MKTEKMLADLNFKPKVRLEAELIFSNGYKLRIIHHIPKINNSRYEKKYIVILFEKRKEADHNFDISNKDTQWNTMFDAILMHNKGVLDYSEKEADALIQEVRAAKPNSIIEKEI